MYNTTKIKKKEIGIDVTEKDTHSPSKESTSVSSPTYNKSDNQKFANDLNPDPPIPIIRIENAIDQLSKFLTKKTEPASTLINNDELTRQIQLIVTNKMSYTGSSKSFKPTLLPIKHSIFAPWKENSFTSPKDFKVLLILRDQDKNKISENDLFDLLEKPHGIKINQIICGMDLKSTYKAFETRRVLLSEFSLIFSDDSLVTTLPKLLGGKAYKKIQTTPIPIKTGTSQNFSKTTLINSIVKVYNTKLPVLFPRGNTLNIHLGQLDWFKPEEFVENILELAANLIKTQSVRSIFIKSNDSPVIPLYYSQKVLEEVASTSDPDSAHLHNKITIDNVEVELSTFDTALLEAANPADLSTLFFKQINKAKRKLVAGETEAPISLKKKKITSS